MKVQRFKVHSKARSRLSLTHLPVQPLSRVKTLDGPRVRVVSPVVKEKVYGGKDLLKNPEPGPGTQHKNRCKRLCAFK